MEDLFTSTSTSTPTLPDTFLDSIRYGNLTSDKFYFSDPDDLIKIQENDIFSGASTTSSEDEVGDGIQYHFVIDDNEEMSPIEVPTTTTTTSTYIITSDDNMLLEEDEDDNSISSTSSNSMHGNNELKLSEEEKRLLLKEGITLPTHYPLTKFEERELKRIRRKIRNKISAQDSRKRKKEFLDKLQARLLEIESEKSTLNKRVRTLESTNAKLQQQVKRLQLALQQQQQRAVNNSPVATTTTLLVLILSLALVVLPTNNNKIGNHGNRFVDVNGVQGDVVDVGNYSDNNNVPIVVADKEMVRSRTLINTLLSNQQEETNFLEDLDDDDGYHWFAAKRPRMMMMAKWQQEKKKMSFQNQVNHHGNGRKFIALRDERVFD